MSRPRPSLFGNCVGAAFLIGWLAVVGTFDAVALYGLARQVWTYTYAETRGTVLSSRVVTEGDGDDATHRLEVTYAYAAGGRNYTGDRYRYGGWSSGDRTWPRIQRGLPAGARVPVYYDPGDPARAVLRRGPMGMDLFLPWFLAPFNAVGVGLLLYSRRAGRPVFDPADPRLVAPTPTGWEFRPGGRDAPAAFAGAVSAVTFLGSFVIAFTLGFDPPLGLMAGAWAAALAGGWAFALWTTRRVALRADLAARVLVVGRAVIPFDRVAGVDVEEETKTDSDGDVTRRYRVVVGRHGAGVVRVHAYDEPADAAALAAWVREVLAGGPAA